LPPPPFVLPRGRFPAMPGRHDLDISVGADLNTDHAQPGGDHGPDSLGHVALTKCGWPAGLAHFCSSPFPRSRTARVSWTLLSDSACPRRCATSSSNATMPVFAASRSVMITKG